MILTLITGVILCFAFNEWFFAIVRDPLRRAGLEAPRERNLPAVVAALPESQQQPTWWRIHNAARGAAALEGPQRQLFLDSVAPTPLDRQLTNAVLLHHTASILPEADRKAYLAKATALLTISEFSKREIVERLQVDPSRVTVTLLAADDLPLDEAPAPLPDAAAAITGPCFLTVGGQDGRKNLRTLYEAMALLHARGMTVPLLQCGPGLSAQTRALYGAASWLTHVGYVTDEQLVSLYRRATALVFPSRYEGFGLPVLEAMRAGGAVICADASSLPEVAGDAALQFAWNDAPALAERMQRLLTEPALRDTLIARGQPQAARFSWATTAEQTLACFDRAAGARR
jgi:glycosyltransferase involved in cell wall biosynthesis